MPAPPPQPSPLPIDDLLPAIVAALDQAGVAVVEAPPGAGKTTRVPRALLDADFARGGEILVLQPRRLPARLAAARVAEELGERPGERIGYAVRFEEASGPKTRVRFITEGILNRRLLADPRLQGVSVVVLDEFHERHLATDLGLTLLRRLRATARPDLRVCVMSATLDTEPIRDYLSGATSTVGGCPVITSEGRRFDVTVEHLPAPDERPLERQVAAAVRRFTSGDATGDILVFLPGAAEIRRSDEALADVARERGLLVLPLHGELAMDAQARAVAPAPPGMRKVILSTNVAETSVTIDGVVVVIDSGLARVAGHSAFTGLPTLSLAKISQASAIQRAGRAGRTRPGVAFRLFTRHDLEGRRRQDTPEIERADLAELVLTAHALGIADVAGEDWLTPPPSAALDAAGELLRRLGALDARGAITEVGRRLLRFPVHPRLGRLMVEGERLGVPGEAALAAALIGERDIRERGARLGGRGGPGARGGPVGGTRDDGADLLTLVDAFQQARAASFGRDKLRGLGLDARAVGVAERARAQLARAAAGTAGRRDGEAAGRNPPSTNASRTPDDPAARERLLARAVLTGFPDRVARRRATTSRTVVLSGGGAAELAFEPDGEFLVALDAEERGAAGRASSVSVRLGCAIEPDWLLDLDSGGDLHESDGLEFDAQGERVVRRARLSYGALTLDESTTPAPASPETARVLAVAATARGAAAFDEPGALDALMARLAFLRELHPDRAVPALDEGGLTDLLAEACADATTFNDLRASGLAARVVGSLAPDARALLANDAPEAVALPGGRRVRVNYAAGQPPWIESRLQDFFGMSAGPAVGGGRVPLTLHLLAPNGRAVQVTRDLESFWRQHYPPLRRELGRRYPRHAWPEDGRHATPPPPGPRRR